MASYMGQGVVIAESSNRYGVPLPKRHFQTLAAKVATLFGRQSRIIRLVRPGYESVLDWATRRRGIKWDINGVMYRIDPHFRHQMGKDYDAGVASLLRDEVRPGAICFDVGANVGVYVLQFAYWSSPGGRVVAFEPNPDAHEILLKHIRLNGLIDCVETIATAVGAEVGEATLYKAGTDGMSSLGAPNKAIAHLVSPITVPVTTLDDFCESTHVVPDWLLMDIEGFEIAALQGASKLIENRRGRLGIIVEMHPGLWDAAGTSRKDAEHLLSKMGLLCVPLTGQREALREHGLVQLCYE
jgi:FkbM family methyltransferase